jgi:hypothetical protein
VRGGEVNPGKITEEELAAEATSEGGAPVAASAELRAAQATRRHIAAQPIASRCSMPSISRLSP